MISYGMPMSMPFHMMDTKILSIVSSASTSCLASCFRWVASALSTSRASRILEVFLSTIRATYVSAPVLYFCPSTTEMYVASPRNPNNVCSSSISAFL